MNNDTIRVGFVSTVNTAAGTVTVVYPDRNNSVTDELPIFCFGGIMQTLKKGSAVLVAHLSNDSTAGIVLGTYAAEGSIPAAGIQINNGKMEFKDATGTITLQEIIAKCRQS